MIDLPEHASLLSRLVEHAKDGLCNFAFYGMTTQMQINTSAIATSIIVGVLSAMAATYLQSDRTANDLKREATASSEFRAEMRTFMREQSERVASVSDRTTRLEAVMSSIHPNTAAMSGMSGMNGSRK